MSNKILTFGDMEIENIKLYHHKTPTFLGKCRY